jgi:hypothetical protein
VRGGIYSVPLAPGAQARVRHGALTFFIHSVAPGVVTARKSEIDKPFWVTNGGAFAVLGSLLMLTHLIPSEAGALSVQEERGDEPLRRLPRAADPEGRGGGDRGQRSSRRSAASRVSVTRRPRARPATPSSEAQGRYAIKGGPTAIPSMARDFDPGDAGPRRRHPRPDGPEPGHFMASVDGTFAQGNDDSDAWGSCRREVGESFGNGGLGLVGTGPRRRWHRRRARSASTRSG